MSTNKPLIVITAGDPAGIGPEIIDKVISDKIITKSANFEVIATHSSGIETGKPTERSGRAAFDNIVKAVEILRNTQGPKAMVTAPINKFALSKAGINFNGHTEILETLTGVKNAAMMFSGGFLKLALVTRHVPLSEVSKELNTVKIVKTTSLFSDALRDMFGMQNPKIGIAGLNPHAGDSGVLGHEEEKVIIPAIRRIKTFLPSVEGPYPSDTLFYNLYKRHLDGAVCMYHDQALGPFKMLYFNKGVNITLGLPFLRTSPDHGTAYDIAGTGVADPSSMKEAVKLAVKLSGTDKKDEFSS